MHSAEVREQNRQAAEAGRRQGELFRLRVAYEKAGRLAYLGHLEVLNTQLSSIRRSGVPFAVGNGFTRRVRVQFSQALPVGASSASEYYDLMLTERLEPEEALCRLARFTPALLAPYEAGYVGRKDPALEAWLNRSSWSVDVAGEGLSADGLKQAIEDVAEEGTLTYLRGQKEKTVDLDQCLVSFDVADAPFGLIHLDMETRATNACSLRPAFLVQSALARPALAGAELSLLRVRRAAQRHEDEDGHLVDAFSGAGETALSR